MELSEYPTMFSAEMSLMNGASDSRARLAATAVFKRKSIKEIKGRRDGEGGIS